jgi:hypothetical protein
MDLWSKGLGRLVLTIRLNERSDTHLDDETTELVMEGTMGTPTYWDWSVNLDEEDVVDFLTFLKRPAPIRYIVQSKERWQMLAAALGGITLFTLRTLRFMIFGVPSEAAALNAIGLETGSAPQAQAANQASIEEK